MVKWTVTDDRIRSLHRNPARTTERAIVQASATRFHGIDSEGIGEGDSHRLVMIRCGDAVTTNPYGFTIDEIFEFLYSNFEPGPRNAYVGFYLGYDFTQWLKTLPRERAWRLLTEPGKASRLRKFKDKNITRMIYWPVEYGKWEFDLLGTKRLKLRPRGSQLPWMYICDVGAFFQSSFLTAINPKDWAAGTAILTDEEYHLIEVGKEHRSDAELDDDMMEYNRLECDVLERLMSSLENGLMTMNIRLKPSQWFGPGQVAQAWLKSKNALSTADLNLLVRSCDTDDMNDFRLAAKESYFGGWFEIFAHGLVPGRSYSYDINSAYPFVISRLPCLQHGRYYQGRDKPRCDDNTLCLVYASVYTKSAPDRSGIDSVGSHAVGAMLHRNKNGNIYRPFATEGWYWKHELDAAIRAGCITDVDYKYYQAYEPCACLPPLADIADLYLLRLNIDKKSPLGKAIKLLINSVYGKFAQSVGSPTYGNPIYASLITAGCRTMILDAIASHPGGAANVLMVATDGVYFLDQHTGLRLSNSLGDWEESVHNNLCLFKPGAYWDDSNRAEISAGKAPKFKARGIRARDFARHIPEVDAIFRSWPQSSKNLTAHASWQQDGTAWPRPVIPSSFSMVSMTQAVQPGWDWNKAGTVRTDVTLEHSAWNGGKRDGLWFDPSRDIYRSKPKGDDWDYWPHKSVPYEKKFGIEDPFSTESQERYGITPDGSLSDIFTQMYTP